MKRLFHRQNNSKKRELCGLLPEKSAPQEVVHNETKSSFACCCVRVSGGDSNVGRAVRQLQCSSKHKSHFDKCNAHGGWRISHSSASPAASLRLALPLDDLCRGRRISYSSAPTATFIGIADGCQCIATDCPIDGNPRGSFVLAPGLRSAYVTSGEMIYSPAPCLCRL